MEVRRREPRPVERTTPRVRKSHEDDGRATSAPIGIAGFSPYAFAKCFNPLWSNICYAACVLSGSSVWNMENDDGSP